MFLNENDFDLSHEGGNLKNDKNRLCLQFKNMLMEKNQEHFDYIIKEEESIFEKSYTK